MISGTIKVWKDEEGGKPFVQTAKSVLMFFRDSADLKQKI